LARRASRSDNDCSPLFYLAVRASALMAIVLTFPAESGAAGRVTMMRLVRGRTGRRIGRDAVKCDPGPMQVGDPCREPAYSQALVVTTARLPLIAVSALGKDHGHEARGPAYRGFSSAGMLDSNPQLPVFAVGGRALAAFITRIFLIARSSALVAGLIVHGMADAWGNALGPKALLATSMLVASAFLLVRSFGLRGFAPLVISSPASVAGRRCLP